MHIAICDDNVADRKQTERLIRREAERRLAQSVSIYADSFGNADALLSNPMQYDVFYIDLCHTEGVNGLSVAKSLTDLGVQAPIVLCCSEIDYRQYPVSENIFFLDKPLKVSELSKSLDRALEIRSHAPSLIELREEKNTFYVTEADILYATETGRGLVVTLRDGRSVTLGCDAINFFSEVECYRSFVQASFKTVINCRYIRSLRLGRATMTDGTKFRIGWECLDYAKAAFEQFSGEN